MKEISKAEVMKRMSQSIFLSDTLTNTKKENKGNKKASGSGEVKVKKTRATNGKEQTTQTVFPVPKVGKLGNLEKGELDVYIEQHNIHYKEQDWGVPARRVKFNLELANGTGKAKYIAEKMHGKASGDKLVALIERAEKGNARYYDITTYEALPFNMQHIGFVEVTEENNGELKSRVIMLKDSMENMRSAYKSQSVEADVRRELNRIIKKACM